MTNHKYYVNPYANMSTTDRANFVLCSAKLHRVETESTDVPPAYRRSKKRNIFDIAIVAVCTLAMINFVLFFATVL